MQQRPAIAVVAPNVLMGVGLKAILEKIIPMADVELFGDFETFAQATPERFFHFFVAAQLFVTHSSYFRPLRHKTILLCNGQPQPAYADMHRIDVCTSEETVVRDILRMHHGRTTTNTTSGAPLTPPAYNSRDARPRYWPSSPGAI